MLMGVEFSSFLVGLDVVDNSGDGVFNHALGVIEVFLSSVPRVIDATFFEWCVV